MAQYHSPEIRNRVNTICLQDKPAEAVIQELNRLGIHRPTGGQYVKTDIYSIRNRVRAMAVEVTVSKPNPTKSPSVASKKNNLIDEVLARTDLTDSEKLMLIQNVRNGVTVAGTMVEITEYKNRPIFGIYECSIRGSRAKSPIIAMGFRKAKALLTHAAELEQFVKKHTATAIN